MDFDVHSGIELVKKIELQSVSTTFSKLKMNTASSRLSRLVAHFHIFRLFMKGNFDAYVL